jgi:uncharacterized protein YcbX
MAWQLSRVGFAPVKGTRHLSLPEVRLETSGPVGDRRFCLVDPDAARALRTVENPSLIAVSVRWDDPELSCRFPDGREVAGRVRITGDEITFDYWGRQVRGRVVEGPWAAAFGDHVGRPVLLVACAPGDVVFGDSITLVTTSALVALGEALAIEIDPARLRATMVVDDGGVPGSKIDAPQELGWVGRELAIGSARVRVTEPVARCAVIDIHPVSGERDGRLLKTLARAGIRDERFGDPIFGVQGVVVRPGVVRPGDPVELLEAP